MARPPKQAQQSVLLVGGGQEWPPDLVESLTGDGYAAVPVDELAAAPALLVNGGVRAVFVGSRPLGGKDLLVLRECRQVSPTTAIVVVMTAPTPPDLKRAFESGATAFLSWPAPAGVLRQALGSGGHSRPMASGKA